MLTYTKAYNELKTELAELYDSGEATTISDMLLTHITGFTYTQRLINKESLFNHDEIEQYNRFKSLLVSGTPIQYITNVAYFMGKEYYVDENVLIPRPETEELVQWIVSENTSKQLNILDIGTGSGCIPVSLKQLLPEATITSIDISTEALQVAEKNAKQNNTDVSFLHFDFLNKNQWDVLPSYNILVSNPPYIPISEKEKLDRNVRDHEPGTALFVPDNDALLFYRHIAEFGQTHLNTSDSIFCEVHQNYAADTMQMFDEEGYKTVLKKDIFGNQRMIQAKK